MFTAESDRLNKSQPALNAFVERASGRLSGVRNGILIFDQDPRSYGDLDLSIRNLQLLRKDAAECDRSDVVALSDECEDSLRSLADLPHGPASVGRSLDLLAKIEESLLRIPLESDDFLPDISGFVDRSFEGLKTDLPVIADTLIEEFELDDETFEIFRSEACDLIQKIKESIDRLHVAADDREVLWEVRRNAHTFKGAAGIVGFKAASELAHRVEDLLDKMVESNATVDQEILDLLVRASKKLEIIALGGDLNDESDPIEGIYCEFERVIAAVPGRTLTPPAPLGPPIPETVSADKVAADKVKLAPTSIVRVSLDRLDELIKLSRALNMNHSALVQRFSEFGDQAPADRSAAHFEKLSSLLVSQRNLTLEVQQKLYGIRLVRFGTLETRLSRAIHVTSQEENKRVIFTLENGDCEVDTQVIDALIEPLLHLLKNAVVHGIESAETRRLIGKPEKGEIRVCVDSDECGVTLRVIDDGRGISVSRLKQRAVANGLITPETAASLSGSDAISLVFHRGLTTADKVDLNAGRGIGMSIVKESIESNGGDISITSELQVGTTFTIRLPLVIKNVAGLDRTSAPEQQASPKPNETQAASVSSKLVLIVDDSATIRRQTVRLVEEAGHRAIIATDGIDALELLLSDVWRPDLILSDIEMPKMDGWEFLECVKNTDATCDIPVVMVTSLDADEHRHRAFLLGASGYNVKPIDRDRIQNAIEGVFSNGLSGSAAGSA